MHIQGKTLLITMVISAAVATAAYAGGKAEDSGSAVHVDENDYAAHGADVVAYYALEAGEPAVEGSTEYAYTWRGATWLFASQEHLDQFRADPERYAPAYGGYCAWAMARDNLAPIDPDRWNIVDGTLYLNYSARTQRDFVSEIDSQIEQADEHWVEKRAELMGESDT